MERERGERREGVRERRAKKRGREMDIEGMRERRAR